LASSVGTAEDQQALGIILEPGLHVDAVDPEVDALGREIAPAPAHLLFRSGILESGEVEARTAPRYAASPFHAVTARALYLGNTLYRIHGTNQPSTIGQFVSSGCIRLLNEDIEDLYNRITLGTRVVVLPGGANPDRRGSDIDPR